MNYEDKLKEASQEYADALNTYRAACKRYSELSEQQQQASKTLNEAKNWVEEVRTKFENAAIQALVIGKVTE